MIILDYRVSVDLVASINTEQQAQSRSTYHVQKTNDATEINTRTTRNYAYGLAYPATEDIMVTESS